jgi:hypothetical protein
MSLQPKNWTQFQHYKDRKPPWIKLHRGLLDDFAYAQLPLASRALAPLLWLLASEFAEGKITATLEEIAFRLHVSVDDLTEALKPLVNTGLFIDDSDTLAACKQDTRLEREGETQEQTEVELSSLRSERDVSHAISDDWPKDYREQFWDAYPRKVGRKAAYAKLKIIRASGEVTFAKLIAAVRAIRAGEPRFIPHATTWLNRGGWDDDPAHGGFSGFGGSRSLQDDSRSVSRALDRLGAELEQGTIEFAPRPRLVQDQGEGDLRLLPPGRGTGS